MEFIDKILQGDCRIILQGFPEKCIHTVATSPPYYGLRSYQGILPTSWPEMAYSIFGFEITVPGMVCELGHECDPKYFIGHLILIFREVKRVLRDDGTAWINMGDSYATTGGAYNSTGSAGSSAQVSKKTLAAVGQGKNRTPTTGLKNKDMIGIPWMLAYALRDDGWYLRSDIIWSKKNTMPESVTDRPTKSHEYIFLFSKSQKYFYDAEAIKTPAADSSIARWDQDLHAQTQSARVPGKTNGNMKAVGGPMKDLPEGQTNIRKARDKQRGHSRRHAGFNDRWDAMTTTEQRSMGANKRTVWHMATNSFKDAHFATFPEELITDPIKAGTSEHGCCSACGAPYLRDLNGWIAQCKCDAPVVPCTVLDPFSGAGTTFMVAKKLNRRAVGIELSTVYTPMSEKRVNEELGMFSPLK